MNLKSGFNLVFKIQVAKSLMYGKKSQHLQVHQLTRPLHVMPQITFLLLELQYIIVNPHGVKIPMVQKFMNTVLAIIWMIGKLHNHQVIPH